MSIFKILMQFVAPMVVYLGVGTIAAFWFQNSLTPTILAGIAVIGYMMWFRQSQQKKNNPMFISNTNRNINVTTITTLFVLAFIVGQTAAIWFSQFYVSENYNNTQDKLAEQNPLMVTLVVVIMAPIAEEALLRATMYPVIRAVMPIWAAAIITSVIFGVMHGNMIQFIATIPLGIVAAIAYEMTRSVALPFILHMWFNATASMLSVDFVSRFAHPTVWIALGTAFIALVVYQLKHMPRYEPPFARMVDKAKAW